MAQRTQRRSAYQPYDNAYASAIVEPRLRGGSMPNQNSARKERPQETKSSVSTPFASSNGEEF